MAKSASELVEEILLKCNQQDKMSLESEVKIRDYICQHIEAVKRQAADIVSRTDGAFVSDMGLLGDEGRAFLERINLELGKVRRSDIT